MWLLDGRKYRQGMYDDRFDDPATWGGFDKNRLIPDARIHGNPFLDCGVIGWQKSTAAKRAERDAFEGTADADDDEAISFPVELFDVIPAMIEYTLGSIMILDADDPELLECTETALHERLTSHLAEPFAHLDPVPDWAVQSFRYMERMFLTTIESGHVPAPILVEPVRQRMGFPYEWMGAEAE